MPFPTEFPALEIKQIVKFITKQDADLSKAVLAGYTILGYAGYQAFGQPVLQLVGTANEPPVEPTKAQLVASIAEVNDLLNKIEGVPTLKQGSIQIPQWLMDYVLTLLQTYLKKLLGA